MLATNRLKSQIIRRITLLFALMLVFLSFGALAPVRSYAQDDVQFGRIHVMALDDQGNGWAWAGIVRPRPGNEPIRLLGPSAFGLLARDPEPFSYLLRIEGSRWSIFADSNSAPTLLVPGLDVYRMLVSGDGQEGWATGTITGADGKETAVFMHLRKGAWGPGNDAVPTGFVDVQPTGFGAVQPTGFLDVQPTGFVTVDATMSGDGSLGYMTMEDASPSTHLLTLQDNKWVEVAQPQGANIGYVAVSADGKHGLSVSRTTAGYSIYELSGGTWQARANSALTQIDAQQYNLARITADNQGNGWLLASSKNASDPSILVRIAGSDAPKYVTVAEPLFLNELTVNSQGLGWAVGHMGSDAASAQPVVLRINNSVITTQMPTGLALANDFDQPGTTVTSSPAGQYAWIGNANGQLGPLYGYNVVGMPATGENYMPVAVISVVLTALGLCVFGLALRRQDTH